MKGDVFIASLGPWVDGTDAEGKCEKCGRRVRYFSAQRPDGAALICVGCQPALAALDVESGVAEHRRVCVVPACPCRTMTVADMAALIRAKLPAKRFA